MPNQMAKMIASTITSATMDALIQTRAEIQVGCDSSHVLISSFTTVTYPS